MADAGDVAMATVAAMAREAPAMRSKTVFTMDARSVGCDGERDACVLRGIVDDARRAAGSAWMDVVDTAVHRCASMSESAPRHGRDSMGAMCSRTVTRVRRRAEASPRTATGARRLAVDATAKDIGRANSSAWALE
jgi:hypothetical protein